MTLDERRKINSCEDCGQKYDTCVAVRPDIFKFKYELVQNGNGNHIESQHSHDIEGSNGYNGIALSPLTTAIVTADFETDDISSPEDFRTVIVPPANAKWWDKLFSYVGPGILVAVAYMDPGNWCTDIAGGSLYNYDLLFVILLSSIVAIFLEYLALKLGISSSQDLAQVCREQYPHYVSYGLWIIMEIAIAATDIAEVLGSAIALKLLFGLPIIIGVSITACDVLVILFLKKGHIRIIEAFLFVLVAIITICFIIELTYSKPNLSEVLQGYLPNMKLIKDKNMLYVAVSIIGATVMPHNLFMHSSLVLTRATRNNYEGKKEAIFYCTIDSTVCLIGAFFVNSFILMMAASAFYTNGFYGIASLENAYTLLNHTLGTKMASYLFAIALLASGQSATFTGTYAGQIVMEGFIRLKLPPSYRRLLTRLIAIVPALIVTAIGGEESVNDLLLFSQVVLSFALPFAIFPLAQFTSDKSIMREFVNTKMMNLLSWLIFLVITFLNIFSIFSSIF